MQQNLNLSDALQFFNKQQRTIEQLLLLSYFFIPFSGIFPLLFTGLYTAIFEGKVLLFAAMFFATAIAYFLASKFVDHPTSKNSRILKLFGIGMLIFVYNSDSLVELSVYIFVIAILLSDKLEIILHRIQTNISRQLFNTEREANSYEYELQGLYLQERLKWALSTTSLVILSMIPLYIAAQYVSAAPIYKLIYYGVIILLSVYIAPRILNYQYRENI